MAQTGAPRGPWLQLYIHSSRRKSSAVRRLGVVKVIVCVCTKCAHKSSRMRIGIVAPCHGNRRTPLGLSDLNRDAGTQIGINDMQEMRMFMRKHNQSLSSRSPLTSVPTKTFPMICLRYLMKQTDEEIPKVATRTCHRTSACHVIRVRSRSK